MKLNALASLPEITQLLTKIGPVLPAFALITIFCGALLLPTNVAEKFNCGGVMVAAIEIGVLVAVKFTTPETVPPAVLVAQVIAAIALSGVLAIGEKRTGTFTVCPAVKVVLAKAGLKLNAAASLPPITQLLITIALVLPAAALISIFCDALLLPTNVAEKFNCGGVIVAAIESGVLMAVKFTEPETVPPAVLVAQLMTAVALS